MKRFLLLASLAAAGFVLAGCGSAKTPHTGPATLVGTTTIAHRPTGAPIQCKHGAGADVPPPGQGVAGTADGPTSSSEIRVIHRRDGSVVASCRSG